MPKKKTKVRSKNDPTVNTTFVSMKSAASALGQPLEILRDAKARGCTAFRANASVNKEELIQWLIEDRKRLDEQANREPEVDEKYDLLDADEDSEDEGVGRAFKSLQRYERRARKALDLVVREKNTALIKTKEEGWLKVLRELLRYEMNVQTSKREAGELISKADVILAVKALMAWHSVGTSDALRNIIPQLEMRTKVEIARLLDPELRSSIYRGLDSGVKIGRIPDWMAAAAKEEMNVSTSQE